MTSDSVSPERWKKVARMTDPSNALKSFQQALLRGETQLRPGVLDPDLYLYVDNRMAKLGLPM